MKIFINFCEEDPAEDEEAGKLVEVLRDNMPQFSMCKWTELKNHKGNGTHSCYVLQNYKHPEI